MRALLLIALVAGDLVAPGGVLAAGTRLEARMNTSIGTTESAGPGRVADETRAGAPFAATIDGRIVDDKGHVLLPAGAIVQGRVTRLARGEGVRRAVVELAVERVDKYPIAARVVEVEVQQMARNDSRGAVDTSAFWGALVGGLAFGIPGVAVGHSFGGGVGAVQATGVRQIDGWVSAGSSITIELEAPLALAPCVAARDRTSC